MGPLPPSGYGNLEISRMYPTSIFSWTLNSLPRNQSFLENNREIKARHSAGTRELCKRGP